MGSLDALVRSEQVNAIVGWLLTGVGIAAGGIFEWYFERFEHVGSHERPIVSARRP